MKKFEWQATEGAPKGYPMEIVAGSLQYHDKSGSLYVPNKIRLSNGWGNGRSSHVVGDERKPLPDRLKITFFSYTEDQFYEGDFELPYDEILSLFQTGFYSAGDKTMVTYKKIIVGVAPGGAVSVWLWGYEKKTEVFHGQAEKIEGNWKSIIDNPKITRQEFIDSEIKESLRTQEAYDKLKKQGIPFGRWTGYHKKRYDWQPLFTNLPLLDKRIELIKYYNGEQDYIDYPIRKEALNSTRAVPSELSFIWDRPKRKPLSVELYFDETEMYKVFDDMAKDNFLIQLEMRLIYIGEKNDFTVWLKNEKREIEIKKIKIETYGIPEREPA